MRKLAPLFITTTILAFAGANAFAASQMSDSATNQAKPTGNSDSSTAGAMAPSVGSTATSGSPTVPANTQNPQGMSYSDKSSSAPGTNAKMDTAASDTSVTTATKAKKAKKKKVAKNDTNADAAGSTTGRSPGGASQ